MTRQHEGDEEVHGRPGRGNDDALVERLVAVGPRLVLGRHLLGGGESGDAHVAAGRDRLDAVFGLAAADGPQPWPEADEVLRHLHARPLRRGEVAQLVEHHDGDEDGDEQQEVAPAGQHEQPGDDHHRHDELQDATQAAGLVAAALERRRGGWTLLLGQCHDRTNATGLSAKPDVAPARLAP